MGTLSHAPAPPSPLSALPSPLPHSHLPPSCFLPPLRHLSRAAEPPPRPHRTIAMSLPHAKTRYAPSCRRFPAIRDSARRDWRCAPSDSRKRCAPSPRERCDPLPDGDVLRDAPLLVLRNALGDPHNVPNLLLLELHVGVEDAILRALENFSLGRVGSVKIGCGIVDTVNTRDRSGVSCLCSIISSHPKGTCSA